MFIDRKQQVAIIIIAAVLLFTAGHRVALRQSGPKDSAVDANPVVAEGSSREISVHVSGAVQSPGVYKFTGQARVMDAVEKAVPLAAADVQGINLARPLKDGEKIEVPAKAEAGREGRVSSGGKTVTSAGPARVNINRAGVRELESLPGLGPALAERVINYRENKGFFTSEEEIKNVPGIGEKKYDQIKGRITVN
ncbi:MAG: ComEA family DNA-binding protein [Actinobacteria bacterium]|nr:ComEA family DNA-binding protein [Actinomycetota bacterium]